MTPPQSVPLPLLTLFLALLAPPTLAAFLSDVLSSYALTSASFNFSVPDTTLNSDDATEWIADNWDINGNKPDWGSGYIVFSPDPSTSTSTLVRRADSSSTTTTPKSSIKSSTKSSTKTSTTSTSTMPVTSPASTSLGGEPPVLRIEYPQGSYSKRTGGTQFYAQPLNTTGGTLSSTTGNSSSNGQYERMLLAYDVWFPSGYGWNMGGKLPGLRGGPDLHGCSGGNETDGTGCFSTRLMWRSSGSGEVYAYVPTTMSGFCSESQITCNSDYGTSLARGSFSFATGQWQTIWLLVILNQVGTANGVVQLYYNGVQALSLTNLELRSSSSISSVGGLFFSTFFGGDDSTWATPTTQYTYFRNMALYAGLGAANGTGASTSAAVRGTTLGVGSRWGLGWIAVVAGFVGWLGLGFECGHMS